MAPITSLVGIGLVFSHLLPGSLEAHVPSRKQIGFLIKCFDCFAHKFIGLVSWSFQTCQLCLAGLAQSFENYLDDSESNSQLAPRTCSLPLASSRAPSLKKCTHSSQSAYFDLGSSSKLANHYFLLNFETMHWNQPLVAGLAPQQGLLQPFP